MSRLLDRWGDYRGGAGPVVATGGDPEGLPELTALLQGLPQSGGEKWARPPYKLLMWLEGSYVKWCATAGDEWPKLWGTCSSLAEGLLGVENAICKEQCEWKKPASNGKVLTHTRV